MTTHNHPQITGSWTGDGTRSTLEFAPTADKNLRAVRSNQDPEHVLYTTPDQVQNIAQVMGRAER